VSHSKHARSDEPSALTPSPPPRAQRSRTDGGNGRPLPTAVVAAGALFAFHTRYASHRAHYSACASARPSRLTLAVGAVCCRRAAVPPPPAAASSLQILTPYPSPAPATRGGHLLRDHDAPVPSATEPFLQQSQELHSSSSAEFSRSVRSLLLFLLFGAFCTVAALSPLRQLPPHPLLSPLPLLLHA